MVQFYFKNDTCKHGRCCFECCVITVFVQWFSLPLLLSIFPPPIHKCSTFSLCILYGIYIVLHCLHQMRIESGSKHYSTVLFPRVGVVVDPLLSGSVFLSVSQCPNID